MVVSRLFGLANPGSLTLTPAMFVGRQPVRFFAATLGSRSTKENVVGNYIGAGLLALPVIVMGGLLCLSLVA